MCVDEMNSGESQIKFVTYSHKRPNVIRNVFLITLIAEYRGKERLKQPL